MSGRLIADYETAACWEPAALAGSNIFICFHAHKRARLPLPLTGGIHQHVESQMNIKPPPPLPSEVLLLCLQVVLPGILPVASRFHVARGIILPFVCTCASAGVCALRRSVTPSQALSFISVFCSGNGPASHL